MIVVEAGVADVLVRIHDGGHIVQQHGGPVAVGDDQILIVRGLGRLVVGHHLVALIALIDVALGAVGICRGDGGAHVLEPDAVTGQLIGLDLDPHRGQGAAAQLDLTDAGDLGELLLNDGVGGIVELGRGKSLRGERPE